MPKLTDQEIITALKNGQTIRLGDKICVRELLNGNNTGVLYACVNKAREWKPFNPSVSDFEQNSWEIDVLIEN